MKIRVKLSPWWCDTGAVTHRVNKDFIGSHFIDNNIELVDGDDYDFLVVLGYLKEGEKVCAPPDKVLVFTLEPSWSQNRRDEDSRQFSSRVFITDKTLHESNYDEYIETPVRMLFGGMGEYHAEPKWDWAVDHMISNDPMQKDKLLSIVQRNQECSWIPGQDENNILYEKRCRLAHAINDSDIDVDIYGEYWEADDRKVKGTAWSKKLGLLDYKFSMAIENTVEKNYYTEKFWDCILNQTIPVYYGCPNIYEIVESDCFIQLPDISNHSECMDVINGQCSDVNYNRLFSNLIDLKDRFYNSPKYNLWHKIREEIYKT
jgi:hypothetical protein